jgi:hypothetical protein
MRSSLHLHPAQGEDNPLPFLDEVDQLVATEIGNWMTAHAYDYIDPFTDEINTTALAEQAAIELGHPEWAEDEQHVVWDLAVDIGQAKQDARLMGQDHDNIDNSQQ